MIIAPTITRRGNTLLFTWPDGGPRVLLSHFDVTDKKIEADLKVLTDTALITEFRTNLQAQQTRKRMAQDLNEKTPGVDWLTRIEQVCVLGVHAMREGEPFIELAPGQSALVPFLLNPLIYENSQTLWYAPGGSCKSYLALYLSLLAGHGARQHGLMAAPCPVLYLDWELNHEIIGSRLFALRNGHPELCEVRPYYRRCEAPLHKDVDVIADKVAEWGVKLVVVDSVALACGGELASPDAAIKLQRALRTLGCASLVLAHVAKNSQEGQERTAYGTVFFRELARNVWEAERLPGDNPVQVILTQKKNNFGPLRKPLGLSLEFDGDAVTVDSCDPMTAMDQATVTPLSAQIRTLLEDGTPRTAREIADVLGAKLATARVMLSSGLKSFKWMALQGENGQEMKYTVLHPNG